MKKALWIFAPTLALTLSLTACGTPRPVPANQGEAQTAAESASPAEAQAPAGQQGEIEFTESAGGFGVRFARMLDTFTLLEG